MRSTIALLLALMPGIAGAQINKCLDASGKTVGYATVCPSGTRSEATSIKNAPHTPPAAPQNSLAERDADFRKRQLEQQDAQAKTEKKSAEAAQYKRACDEARSYLKSLQERQRIARVDPKTGERKYLSDADYPREIAEANKAVAENCR